MKKILIVTGFEATAGRSDCLYLRDHRQRLCTVLTAADQRVNLQSLLQQQAPFVLFSDRLETLAADRLQIPADAMISVMPAASGSIQALLESGQAEQLLLQLGGF
ncbi:hypothetical protein [Marinobacterium jannaschii]|uniref:hypothetical protein n=1 Tax=Marinobacterium jannaschii TaxID=64970 RepID=UPI00047FA45C|nr:hypothetical protein [Marinobacterium jannaschii]